MGRSLSRFTLLIGSAIAGGSLLAGCASAVPGPAVIGAPAAQAAIAPASNSNNYLAGLEQSVTSELNAINSTQSDNEPPEVLVELNALNNEGSLIAAENFASLVTTASNQLLKRQHLVSALIVAVEGSTYLSGVDVNGASLSSTLESRLNSLAAELQSQANAVGAAGLADQLRAVILNIGPSTRILGLVQPQIHLAIAAGEEIQAAIYLRNQYNALNNKALNHEHLADKYGVPQQLSFLNADIASAMATATADANAVLALTSAGYPGNKATIVNVRAQLVQVKSPLGPLNAGSNLVTSITGLESAFPSS